MLLLAGLLCLPPWPRPALAVTAARRRTRSAMTFVVLMRAVLRLERAARFVKIRGNLNAASFLGVGRCGRACKVPWIAP